MLKKYLKRSALLLPIITVGSAMSLQDCSVNSTPGEFGAYPNSKIVVVQYDNSDQAVNVTIKENTPLPKEKDYTELEKSLIATSKAVPKFTVQALNGYKQEIYILHNNAVTTILNNIGETEALSFKHNIAAILVKKADSTNINPSVKSILMRNTIIDR